ncbi:thioredoxin domain-containing protein [Georgenia sp. SYP-B2076]|uniref:DsbA family protein n=1 Tax=Georgenia sp. SYP-B2076 TaxID=2495881 RepID=UPI000F8E96CA|nr:thioredoxin domain-containing protein [Georgenia sp. SYP-B2076]
MPSSSSNMSKAEKREAAREQARVLREAQAKREKRNRNLIIIGIVALIAIVAVAVYSIVSAGNEKAGQSAIEQVSDVPANSSMADGGISLGSSLVAGTANKGAPTIDVYLDYTCPHCADFEKINGADVDELVSTGKATVVYHPIPLLDQSGDLSGFSGRAVNAAATVADKAPEAYNAFQKALFALYANATDPNPTGEQIAAAAVQAGVPQAVADTFTAGTFKDWAKASLEQFAKDGYRGTPTVLINGKDFEGWSEKGALAKAVAAA